MNRERTFQEGRCGGDREPQRAAAFPGRLPMATQRSAVLSRHHSDRLFSRTRQQSPHHWQSRCVSCRSSSPENDRHWRCIAFDWITSWFDRFSMINWWWIGVSWMILTWKPKLRLIFTLILILWPLFWPGNLNVDLKNQFIDKFWACNRYFQLKT